MLTLAIDTASDACGVALWDGGVDGTLRAERERIIGRGHGEALFGLVGETLDEAGVSPTDITRLAAIRGPGTFTGLRIGLAAVRGLALALNAEAMALTTFELIATGDLLAHGDRTRRMVALDARREELYVCVLGPDFEVVSAPAVHSAAAAADLLRRQDTPCLLIGSGAAHVMSEAQPGEGVSSREVARPTAGLLARLAASRAASDCPPDPLYIRPPDAKLPQAAPLREAKA